MGIVFCSFELVMDKYEETFQTWEKVANKYEEIFMDLSIYDDSYMKFAEALQSPEASLLEIACGPGNITRFLLNRFPKFQILGTDVSENMLILAKKNVPNAHFLQMDCRNISELNKQFDGIIAGFVLPYLSDSDCLKLFSDVYKLLKNNALIYLSFVPGKHEQSGFKSGSLGYRAYFYYHETERVKQQLLKNGFMILHEIEVEYPVLEQETEAHVIIIAQKT